MKLFSNKIFILLIVAVFAVKCDVLETTPKGVLAEGTLNSASAIDKLTVAAYSALAAHFFGNDQAFAGPSNNWIMDVRSDDAYKGGGGINDRTDIFQLETQTMDATNYAAHQKWRNNMFGIARCNLAIREIAKLDDANYPKAIRTAEMKFLRAHFHFDLKRNFNQIPYIDENTDPTAASNTALTSDEAWARIKQDFQEAFNDLPPSQDEVGRVNNYAAAAYLAKVAIETQQWAEAISNADFVINGPYALLDQFENLSELEFENSEEAVFQVQYSTANLFANHDWSSLLNSTTSPGIDSNGDGVSDGYPAGDDFYHGSQNLVNAFRTDATTGLPLFDSFNDQDVFDASYGGPLDPRVDFTFGRLGISWKGENAEYSTAWVRDEAYLPGFSSKKAVVRPDEPNIHNSWPWAAAGLNYNMIRFAEVLLWKAEALVELNQNLEEARTLVNQVRSRAKNSRYVQKVDGSGDAANYFIEPYPAAGWTQDYARQAVRFERRLELAMEGHRFYDLVRWGVAEQVINQYYAEERDNVTYLDGAQFTAGKHEFLPIPQIEIDLAPQLYSQNNGY